MLDSRTQAPPVQTIQKTAKLWKGAQLIGCVTVLAGVILLLSAPDMALPVMGVGLVAYLAARILGWWEHG
jgi:uncharacterized membrane protein YkgB